MSDIRMTDLEAAVRISLPCEPAIFARLVEALGRPKVRSLTVLEYAGALPEKVLNLRKQLLHAQLGDVYLTITGGLSAMQIVQRSFGALPFATPDRNVQWAHYLFTFPPECADPAVKYITAMQARPARNAPNTNPTRPATAVKRDPFGPLFRKRNRQ